MQLHRDGPGHVVQRSGPAPDSDGHDHVARTPRQRPGRLDPDLQQLLPALDGDHLGTVQSEQQIAPLARIGGGLADDTPRDIGHRRGPREAVCLVATDPEILDQHQRATRPTGASPHPHQIREEPLIVAR